MLTTVFVEKVIVMSKYIEQVLNFWEYKIFAGLIASFYVTDIVLLFTIFCCLEILDIATKWLQISAELYNDTFKGFPPSCYGVVNYIKSIPTARRMRKIRSGELRVGFCNKMITYLLLFLLSMLTDGALTIAYGMKTRVLLIATTSVCGITETLSIFENLSGCGIPIVNEIKNSFLAKIKK